MVKQLICNQQTEGSIPLRWLHFKDKCMRKRYKLKKRSCAMCKPHKMKWEDKRTLQQKKKDEADKKDYGYVA